MDLCLLGAIKWYWSALAIIFIITCIILIIIVLLQKGRGGGLSAAFGGAGGQSAFGSKTGDVFTWVTIVVVAVFLLTAMILTMNYKPFTESDTIGGGTMQAPPGAEPPAPQDEGETSEGGASQDQSTNTVTPPDTPAPSADGGAGPSTEGAGDAAETAAPPGDGNPAPENN